MVCDSVLECAVLLRLVAAHRYYCAVQGSAARAPLEEGCCSVIERCCCCGAEERAVERRRRRVRRVVVQRGSWGRLSVCSCVSSRIACVSSACARCRRYDTVGTGMMLSLRSTTGGGH